MNLNTIFYIALGSAIAMAAMSIYAWMQLPADAMIAIHWNIEGNVDNFTSKTLGLASIPTITLLMAGLLKALPHLEPRNKNLQQSSKLIGATWVGVIMVMWAAQYTIVGTALGWAVDILLLLKITMGLMLILIGNYAAKSKSMFMVGFRTPWTLSSETVWKKTHTLFGRLFMLAGLILVAMPIDILGMETFSIMMIALIMAPVLICLVYSWVIWKQEQKEKA